MKSKFTPIVKVRKQQCDMVEIHLSKARLEKHKLEQKVISTCKEIEKTSVPTNGDISLMNIARERLSIIRRTKDNLNKELLAKKEEIRELGDKYKKAYLEFEKIKYLQEQEFVRWIEKSKKQESLNMDEISNMLFRRKI